jgi:hypothetical protein
MFERDIAEGITILNRHDLGWAHRINVDELDMLDPVKDLLGQLYEVVRSETSCKVWEDYVNNETFCGFAIQDAIRTNTQWGILTREWQRIIRYIQENIPADEPFEATLGSLWEREI